MFRARAASPPAAQSVRDPDGWDTVTVTSQLQWTHSSEDARHNVRWRQRRYGHWGWGENGEHGRSAVQRGCVSLQVNVVGSAVTNIRSDLCVIVTYSKTWLLHPACTIVFLLPLCQCECPNQTLCRVPWAERRAGVRLPENGAGLSGVRAPLPLPSTHSRHLGCRALYSRNIQHKLQCEKKRDFVKFSAEKCNEASAPVLKSPFPRFGCHLVQVGSCWGERTQVSQFCFV